MSKLSLEIIEQSSLKHRAEKHPLHRMHEMPARYGWVYMSDSDFIVSEIKST